MNIYLPFGHTTLTAQIPDNIHTNIIEQKESPPAANPTALVEQALDSLLGGINWNTFVGAKSVAIAVNDKTRPVPHDILLPPLLEKLASIGIQMDAIFFCIAVGAHTPMMPEEFPLILPEKILKNYKVFSHDSEAKANLVYLDKTSRGTPIWQNRQYFEADFKIVIGNIEPHQFVGFSGGVKSAAIGLAGDETINRNHELMTSPGTIIGEFVNNPARQDIEEIGHRIGVDLAVNAILNHNREIVHIVAGEPKAVMQEGISVSRSVSSISTKQRYDLVISSPGGYPKDINVYQAQKGLAHATLITKPGGTIILVAACTEGSGSTHYEDWVSEKRSHTEVINRFLEEGFRIGPHKAYQISRDATNFHLMTFTTMDESLAKKLLLNPVQNLQNAINLTLDTIGPGGRVGVLPNANSTIPFVENFKPEVN